MNKFSIKKIGDIIVMKLHDVKIDYTTVSETREYLFGFAQRQYRKFVIDLGQVERIDSSGIGLFISFWKQYGGTAKLAFCGLQPHITHVLSTACIPKIYPVFKTEQDAVNYLHQEPVTELAHHKNN